jgi:hypothetical protein
MVEIESPSNQDGNVQSTSVKEDLEFVEKVLNGIVKGKIIFAVLMRKIEDLPCLPCGHISQQTLIEMCECYLDKYGNKNGQSAESTAS